MACSSPLLRVFGIVVAAWACSLSICHAFVAPRVSSSSWSIPTSKTRQAQVLGITRLFDATTSSSSDAVSELSEERKAALFQYLLRDLQIEGTPLLALDVDNQMLNLQAALWMTMTLLSENPMADKACMVLEDMSMEALHTVVNDFVTQQKQLQQDERMRRALPELQRFSLSLLGKGVGPAIVIESKNATTMTMTTTTTTTPMNLTVDNELKFQAAMKAFMARMVTKSNDKEVDDVQVHPMLVQICPDASNVCQILSSFFNSLCQLKSTSDKDLGSILLTLPNLDNRADNEGNFSTALDRFDAVSELLSRSLSLQQGREDDSQIDCDDMDLVHFHPKYDRDAIVPQNGHAPGHIPPKSWLQSILVSANHNNDNSRVGLAKGDLFAVYNYQRRSPVPAVWIKRRNTTLLTKELPLEDGTNILLASNMIESQAKTILTLTEKGQAILEQEWKAEQAILG